MTESRDETSVERWVREANQVIDQDPNHPDKGTIFRVRLAVPLSILQQSSYYTPEIIHSMEQIIDSAPPDPNGSTRFIGWPFAVTHEYVYPVSDELKRRHVERYRRPWIAFVDGR
jgi:hypothetical protein